MSCKNNITIKSPYICIGSLNKKIKLKDRDIVTPNNDEMQYDEKFVDDSEVWSMVKTTNGIEIFDGTNTLGVATHIFYIRYYEGLTSEYFIEYNNKNYRILQIENLEEDDEYLKISCTLRGDISLDTNLA